jgi:hypothetical protein
VTVVTKSVTQITLEESRPMRFLARISVALLSLALAQPLLAQGQPIKIYGLVELSGTGATSGTNFNDGVKLAVKEINDAGGILGRKVEYSASDTQSQPQVAKALAVKGDRRWRVRRHGTGVLGLYPRQYGGDEARRDPRTSPAARRRRSRSRAIRTSSARRSRRRRQCRRSRATCRTT